MLKIDKGWLLQVTPVQLGLIREACNSRRNEVATDLMLIPHLPEDDSDAMREEVRQLKCVVGCIDGSLRAFENAPESDYSVDVELNGGIAIA